MTPQIHPDMKVEEVLSRFPYLLDTFVRYGFTPLKNPLVRKTMAHIVTLHGAAKMKHWTPEQLETFLAELNMAASAPPPLACAPDVAEAPMLDLTDVEGLKSQNIFVSEDVIVVDNRGLQPPEPMVRILGIVPLLADAQRLEAINDRAPALLFPRLAELGFSHELSSEPDGSTRVTIKREP